EQQLAFQILRVDLVGFRSIVVGSVRIPDEAALIPLAPIVLVKPVVGIPRFRYSDFEEIWVAEHCVGGSESTSGVTIDTRAADVDPPVALSEFLHSGDLVGQGVVAHPAIVGVVEGLRSPRRSHSVDLDYDKSKTGERLALPSRGQEAGYVCLLQSDYGLAVQVTQQRNRRNVGTRIRVHEIAAGRRKRDAVVRIFRREQSQPLPIHSDLVELSEVRIAAALLGISNEIEGAALLVDAEKLRDVAFSARDLALECAGREIVQIELCPVVALREPDHFVGR